jgi:uncharacterized protein
MRTLILIVLVSGMSCRSHADTEIKGTPAELAQYLNGVPKTVLVTGEAEVRVPAHRAVLSLRVSTESRSLAEALRLNNDLRGKIGDQLKKQGISADRIQSSRFSSTPKFGIFGEKAKSYRIENVMRVAVQDDKEFQSVAALVDTWSEVQFAGVEFEYADKEMLKQKAISQACDNAIEHRKMYEEKLGLKLTPVSFNEGEVLQGERIPQRYQLLRTYTGVDSAVSAGARPAAPPVAAAEESVSSFGELVYTSRVAVEFSAQPK